MTQTVLVLGGSGFIGSEVVRALAAEGYAVRAAARSPERARRLAPYAEWVRAELSAMTSAAAWTPLLSGVDVVVNCAGALQEGAGDRLRAVHVDAPRALIEACAVTGVSRLIHISAVGADAGAASAYARTKAEGEGVVAGSGLNWIIVRPSLVIGRADYGGTALLRALAAFPFVTPMVGGDQEFRPVSLSDLAAFIVWLSAHPEVSEQSMDIAGPETVSLAELLSALRRWLGGKPAPQISVPALVAAPVLFAGDLLGWLGWRSALRSTALRQLNHDVAGADSGWEAMLGRPALRLDEMLAVNPATAADRQRARLYFVRPMMIAALAMLWLVSGVVALGPASDAALAQLVAGGFGRLAEPLLVMSSAVDAALGLAVLWRPWTGRAAVLMFLQSMLYLVSGSVAAPFLWIDPLAPLAKVVPAAILCLVVAATDDDR